MSRKKRTGFTLAASMLLTMPTAAASPEDIEQVAAMVREADNRRETVVELQGREKQPALEAAFSRNGYDYIVTVSSDVLLVRISGERYGPHRTGILEDQGRDGTIDRGVDIGYGGANYIRTASSWNHDEKRWQAWYDRVIAALKKYKEYEDLYLITP